MFVPKHVVSFCVILIGCLHITRTDNEVEDTKRIFSPCRKSSPEFDACVKRAFNKLRPYFKIGIPELGVLPFDPHFAKTVRQSRRVVGVGYNLVLSNVYEKGWTQSVVTKYKTDWENQRIIYSQYFPEKYLDGEYEFKGVGSSAPCVLASIGYCAHLDAAKRLGDAYGLSVLRSGRWNLTLRDYSQTTRVKRNGAALDVLVEVDHIGDMDIHVGNLLRGRGLLESMLDRLINATWKPGFAVIRPLVNDLVSTAFTEIFTTSFGTFPLQEFIQD